MKFFISIYNHLEDLLDYFGDWVYFIIRIYLFAVFFYSGYVKILDINSTITLFEYEYSVPFINVTLAAYLGTFTELLIPWFILFGFLTRFTSIILFIFNAVALYAYEFLWTNSGSAGFYQHFCWGVLLIFLVCYGSKRISLDHILSKYINKKS